MGMDEGDIEMVNIYDLSLLQHARVQGGRCQKQSDSKRSFLPNSIFPNTELTGGEGIGSRKLPYTASVHKTSDALETVCCSENSGGKTAHSYSGGQKSD